MPPAKLDSTWLSIGKRRQFFFDDLMLEQVQDVTRRHYQPERVGPDPLIKKDQPWEHVPYFSCNTWNVIRDPSDGLFKCWYEDWLIDDPTQAPFYHRNEDGKLCVAMHEKWPSRVCYAQSRDGMHWEKPALGIVKEDGRDTNIVLGGENIALAHATYVLLDEMDPDPRRRYKATFETRRAVGGDEAGGEGFFAFATSSDGIHWTMQEQRIRFGQFQVMGDVITVSRDPETGVYWSNNRHPRMCSNSVQDLRKPVKASWISPVHRQKIAQDNRRRVYRSESIDFVNWSSPQPLVMPDNEWDNIDDAFYGMEQVRAGDDWIGLLNILHMTDNTMDVQLAYSRDGRRFERIRPGRAWLAPSEDPGAWDRTMVTICSKPVVVDDDLYVYHAGAANHHDWWMVGAVEGLDIPEAGDMSVVNYGLGLARMKLDRFVSISSAEAREGVVVTPAVFPEGRRLVINARTRPGGWVRVAIADGQDKVIEGFGSEDCVPLEGDEVAYGVQWRANREVPQVEFMKLHFYLRKADLFSFQFS